MKDKDFNDLLTSLDQARKIHAGKLKAARISKFNPVLVKRIRRKLRVSQTTFANMIGVSVDTLQNWEQGRRSPEGSALALLKVAAVDPRAVMKALHA
ncbi:MAG: NadS family protein [Candidatus Omnitrophota bacterium]|jgi:putative transcriptional regulator